MTQESTPLMMSRSRRFAGTLDASTVIVFGAMVSIVAVFALVLPNSVSAAFLLQQIQVAAFLGVLATGAMFVLLIGEIDLSLPWALTVAGMIACGLGTGGESLIWSIGGIIGGLGFGLLVGLWNGFGVAILRAPSMVWTLGLNVLLLGGSVFYAGGYSPQTDASWIMRLLAVGRLFDVIPIAAVVWLVVAALAVVILTLTPLGLWIYAQGRSARVTYLAGVRSRSVTFFVFIWSGMCSALGGILLSGYSGQAFQGMGDPMLLPTIAAIVLGGTQVTGGEGRYLGVVGGVLILTLLSSLLSVLQAPEALRMVIFGSTILLVLLITGRTSGRTH